VIEENRQVYEFDEFRLDAARRQLLREGEVVPLYSKSFDLLLLLVQSGGRDLSKDEILESIWPAQVLEESNLTVNISAVRKALGEKAAQPRYLITIPGLGYRFVANVRSAEPQAEALVFESQTISEITFEQEIDEPQSEPKSLAAPRRVSSVPSLITVGTIVVVAVGIVTYFWLRKTVATKPGFPFERISIKRLTNKGTVSRAAISPDGKLFVYAIPEGDRESLWLGHVDGGEPVQIRALAGEAYTTIKFTPDGSSIYFSVNNGNHNALYKMPVFGGAPEKIRDSLANVTFSRDGKQFAFLRYDQNRKQTLLMTATIEGGDEREVAALPAELSSEWHSPAWSPDRPVVVITGSTTVDNAKLFAVNLADGSTKPVTPHVWRDLEGLTWLKDGSGLVAVGLEKSALHPQLWFISFPDGEARPLITDLNDYGYVTSLANDDSLLALQGISESNIWVAPTADLRAAKQITFDSPGRNDGWNGLFWTPDRRIVYAADDGDGRTLWIISAEGGKPKELIPKGGLNSYPSITADGRYLVFQSNRSGHFAVWRSDLSGENMKQLTGEEIAAQPAVSPDGKWIVYNSSVEGLGDLFRISIDGGQPFRMTDKTSGWAFVSPDSQRVACQMIVDGKTRLAILSLDSGELLKSFDVPRLANLRLGVHWTPDGAAVSYRDWVNGIWKQELAGGEPLRLEGLPEEKLFSYGWSPDAKFFAFARGTTTRDVVLIKSEK